MGMPQFYGSNSAGVNATSANSTCAYPSGGASGDLLVMAVVFRRSSAKAYTVGVPSGWTLLEELNNSAVTGDYGAIYYRFRGAETSVTTTASNSTTIYGHTIILGYRGDIDQANPIDTYASTYSNTSTTAKTIPSVTTTADGAAIANFVFSERSASTTNTWPAGTVEQDDSYAGTTGQISRSAGTSIQPRAGATGTTVVNTSAASTGSFMAKVAIKSAGTRPLFLGSSTGNNTFNASTTCNYPAASASGDFLLMYVYRTVSANGLIPGSLSGWTLIDSEDLGNAAGMHVCAYWKFRGAETSIAVTSSGASVSGALVHINAFAGNTVDSTTPLYAYNKTNYGNVNGMDITPDSMPTGPNNVALSISGAKSFSTGITSNNTAYWKIQDEVITASGCSIFDAVLFAPASPTGIMSRTFTVSSTGRTPWFFAIQPPQGSAYDGRDFMPFFVSGF